jgi:CreA protein
MTGKSPDCPEHPTWWYLSLTPARTLIMRAVALSLASLVALTVAAHAQKRIDAINTNFRWLGPDDKIVVERYDDPKITNVSCYLSRAETGGIKGGLGFAEDPSRFSIACRAVGPIAIPPGLAKSEVIGFSSASLFFKTFQIHRAVDVEKNVLVYTVVSTRLIAGSPFNSISVVPAGVQ